MKDWILLGGLAKAAFDSMFNPIAGTLEAMGVMIAWTATADGNPRETVRNAAKAAIATTTLANVTVGGVQATADIIGHIGAAIATAGAVDLAADQYYKACEAECLRRAEKILADKK